MEARRDGGDDDRVDEIVSHVRRVDARLTSERMERIDAIERVEGRIAQVATVVDGMRSGLATTGNKVSSLVHQLLKIQEEAAAQKAALASLSRDYADHAGQVMSELARVSRRLETQDTVVDRRLTAQDQVLATIKAETVAQTPKIDKLVAADAERASFEAWSKREAKERAERDVAREQRLQRWLAIVIAAAACLAAGWRIFLWLMTTAR